MWKLDQCSNAGLKKAPCSAQMAIIWPKEAAWLTQLIHKAAFAVITLPWLWFLTSTGSPPGSTPPCLGMFVTERGNPGDVFYSAGSQIPAQHNHRAGSSCPGQTQIWFVGGENTNKTTSGRCCSPQDRLATQGSSAKSYSGSREATRAHFHPHPITSAGATKGLASRTTHSACNDWQEKLIRTTAGAGLSLGAVPTPPGLDAPSAGGSQTPAASPPRRCSQRW